jgi:hypothetical protein
VENPTWVTTINTMIINETELPKLTISAYVGANVLYISKHHTMSFEIQHLKTTTY